MIRPLIISVVLLCKKLDKLDYKYKKFKGL